MPTGIDGVEQVHEVGGGATAISVSDGADVAEGSIADAAWVSGNGTIISLLKKIASSGGGLISNDGTFAFETGGNLEDILTALIAILTKLDVASSTRASEATLLTRTKPSDQQHTIIDSSVSLAVTGPLTDTQLRASAVPISAAALPLPTGAATLAGQTQPGVDIGDVTINNAGGGDAVNIQDGGNSVTVDNAGTFATQESESLDTFNGTSSDGGTALTNSAQVIKASAGKVFGWYIYNPNAIAQFVQFYNVAAGSVTVGTTNPLFMLTIPPTSAANILGTKGINFSNAGFSIAATSTAAGNGAPATALDAVIFYK